MLERSAEKRTSLGRPGPSALPLAMVVPPTAPAPGIGNDWGDIQKNRREIHGNHRKSLHPWLIYGDFM